MYYFNPIPRAHVRGLAESKQNLMKNKVSGGDKTCECSRGNESGEHVVTGERSVCVCGGE